MNKLISLMTLLLIFLSDNCIDPDIHMAVRRGDIDWVRRLLESGTSVNERNENQRTPLHLASLRGLEIVQLLLDSGADVNAVDQWKQTPLHYASRVGDIELVTLLLAHGAKINARDKDGETALYAAYTGSVSYEKNRKTLETLIACGAHVWVSNNKGYKVLRTPRLKDAVRKRQIRLALYGSKKRPTTSNNDKTILPDKVLDMIVDFEKLALQKKD